MNHHPSNLRSSAHSNPCSYKAQVSAIVRQFADPSIAASSRRNWDKTPGGSGGQTAGGVVVSTCDAFQVHLAPLALPMLFLTVLAGGRVRDSDSEPVSHSRRGRVRGLGVPG